MFVKEKGESEVLLASTILLCTHSSASSLRSSRLEHRSCTEPAHQVDRGSQEARKDQQVRHIPVNNHSRWAPDPSSDRTRCSLITDDHCQVLMGPDAQPDPHILAIGDCAMIEGTPMPATAQVANQKAKYITKKLNRRVKGGEPAEPFVFHNMGSLAYLGGWQAVYDRTQAQTVKTKEAGRLAWLLWRSAYFTRTLSVRNKILVPMYWCVLCFFAGGTWRERC